MKEKIDIYAQVLNLQNRLYGEILKAGQRIIDTINEYKRFEAQYQYDKKRIEFEYNQIMKDRK